MDNKSIAKSRVNTRADHNHHGGHLHFADHYLYLFLGNMTPRVGAILLAFFFGGFGAQKFYMGQIGYGVACVLFCWTGIPTLIAIYDIIVFLLTSDEDWEKRYWRK